MSISHNSVPGVETIIVVNSPQAIGPAESRKISKEGKRLTNLSITHKFRNVG
jgi:hypothetical protein